jgi:hypothetical protein
MIIGEKMALGVLSAVDAGRDLFIKRGFLINKMSKHTPGPWLIAKEGIRTNAGFIAWFPCPRLKYEGQKERYEKELEEDAANAKLIAAAPMMIEALERVDEELQTWYDAGGSHREVLTELVKAAIRAAKGE